MENKIIWGGWYSRLQGHDPKFNMKFDRFQVEKANDNSHLGIAGKVLNMY